VPEEIQDKHEVSAVDNAGQFEIASSGKIATVHSE
jgi:hypothetical protein